MQVTVTIKTVEQKFPGGTVGGSWRIDVVDPANPTPPAFTYEGPSPSTTFDLPEGTTYNIRGAREDAAGTIIGPIATTSYTVGEDLVLIDVAGTISATATPGTRK